MVLADTGPLYAALDPSDDNHDRAQRDIEHLDSEGLAVAVAYTTLCECYSFVLSKLGIEAARGWLAEVQESASLVNPILEDFGEAAAVLRSYGDQALSLFDAVTVALSWRLGLSIWTYDHLFDVVRAEVWRRV